VITNRLRRSAIFHADIADSAMRSPALDQRTIARLQTPERPGK
jgi:hypothetical protein